MVLRVYVEKKPGFAVEASQLKSELCDILGITRLADLRLINRYDVEGIETALFEQCVPTVFSEPQSDDVAYAMTEIDAELAGGTPLGGAVFATEYLPGQFDQRADSASECIQLISQGERPVVRSAKVYILNGSLTQDDVAAIKHYVINPVEAREASLEPYDTLTANFPVPEDVERIDGFREFDEARLATFINERGLAMDAADIAFCQQYFIGEERDPTITEIKMIDTYWSDHCRHTTFGTQLREAQIDDDLVRAAFERYLEMRHELCRDEKPICLMDMGTIGARYLKANGILTGLDESEEVNACTVRITCDVDGTDEDWLYLFKNETHNHPTEIEPFGGAATCVGGAIRDPLSGRSYVYQAMRVTGAANPLVPLSETLPGKLPQRKLVTAAAAGYSSYGNQIGLTTGQVSELYHPGYAAKRMEIGAVVGATPADHVRRETPAPGDVVLLLGGRTGRDGIGGATGSSKAHSATSIETCGAEVQKGNAPVERRIQRLFRRKDACEMIKRCNDFGAGGVSVAVGELADGLFIELDKVTKKYDGLDGTELAISESQERMAVALAADDADAFIALAHEENLEATVIAHVTEEKRVRMVWRGDTIVDVSRDFLASNGAPKYIDFHVEQGETYSKEWGTESDSLQSRLQTVLTDLNICSNKGLTERFDSTIGAATVLMPFGGTRQLTPNLAMVAKLPVDGETTTCSGMAWGFNPYLSSANQYIGAYTAVVESVSRLVASGFDHTDAYLTFQEYFEKLRQEPTRWGKPVASVLGALMAQLDIGVGSIGGKDSMSGSFEQLDVPPTLVSFATAIGNTSRVTSPEFKKTQSRVVYVRPAYREDGIMPTRQGLLDAFDIVERLTSDGDALAVSTPGYGCLAESLFKMCVGNKIGIALEDADDAVWLDGVALSSKIAKEDLFVPAYGSFVVEVADDAAVPVSTDAAAVIELGITTKDYTFAAFGEIADLGILQEAWESKLEPVFPYRAKGAHVLPLNHDTSTPLVCSSIIARPRVIIPVFPGTNCEFDSARAFERAGAKATTFVINNLTPAAVAESTAALATAIDNSQIIMIPGGFSGGDEPDGSAKFITAFFRSPAITEAVRKLLNERDGLILGICNGFQALVKLGLVPFGDIRPMDTDCPTLTFNDIGRHQSRLVHTRVASNLSPWFSKCQVGDIHTIPVSHGEGRFVAPDDLLEQLVASGQIASQYVDASGQPSMDLSVNPNGSVLSIEGITSPDGRVLGKMGHSERSGNLLYKNVPGNTFQPLIEGGVNYFA